MRAPSPRGPLSAALLEALTGAPGPGPAVQAAADRSVAVTRDVIGDEDVQLALLVLYELHYRGVDGVDEAWEWQPDLLRVRASLENPSLARASGISTARLYAMTFAFGAALAEPAAPKPMVAAATPAVSAMAIFLRMVLLLNELADDTTSTEPWRIRMRRLRVQRIWLQLASVPAMIVRWLTAAAIVVGAALVGLVVWITGLAGLANRAESLCFADLDNRPGHGAYQISSELWPPSFECRLLGNSVEPIVVEHPLEAIVAFGWIVVVPVLCAIATLVLTLRWLRQPRPELAM